jgi:hypothetical protein
VGPSLLLAFCFSNFQVSSVNIYYLLANETVDDIIWYMPWTLFSLYKFCALAHALNCLLRLLLCRDVVQGKLENLGQVRYLFLSLTIFC